jgi:enediyne biosynthesis protein E4
VIVANQRGPLLVYANTVSPGRHWIAFELEGTVSNRSAIGARVEVEWNGQRQVQEVSGGSGFSAQNQRRLHYGLGSTAEVGKVTIRWPSGRTETIERPAADRLHRVKESR